MAFVFVLSTSLDLSLDISLAVDSVPFEDKQLLVARLQVHKHERNEEVHGLIRQPQEPWVQLVVDLRFCPHVLGRVTWVVRLNLCQRLVNAREGNRRRQRNMRCGSDVNRNNKQTIACVWGGGV